MWGTGGLYATWADFLDRFAAGQTVDPSQLPRLNDSDLPPDGWERFGRRLGDAVGDRLNLWSEGLNRGIAEARDEFEVGRALTSARGGLRTIRALARHPALPDELGDRLLSSIDDQVRRAQSELEGQAESSRRSGTPSRLVEARLRTLRDNALTIVVAEEPSPAKSGSQLGVPWGVQPGSSPRRRLTFD